jgi:hypothetical protein
MEADQRRAVAALLADDQRDMLAQIVDAAEGDDLGVVAGRDGQPRPAGDGEVAVFFQSARSSASTLWASPALVGSIRKAGRMPAMRASSLAARAVAMSGIGSARKGP